MVKAIIFDLWNTLAYSDTKRDIIDQLFDKMGVIKTPKNYKKMEESFMLKEYSVEEAMENLCRVFGKDENIAGELVEVWKNVRINLFPDVMPALKKLRKKYKLGLISNTQSFSLGFFYENKFFDLFDCVCLSFDVGLLKPDKRIFQLALKNLKTKPKETIMIGDNLDDDVLAAEKLGIKGILISRPTKKTKKTWKRIITDLEELERFL